MKPAYAFTLILPVFVIGLVFIAGCSGPQPLYPVTTTPTKAPAVNLTASPTLNQTENIAQVTVTVITPIPTPTPIPAPTTFNGYVLGTPAYTQTVTPTIIPELLPSAFTTYTDDDFSVSYPSNWSIRKSVDNSTDLHSFGSDLFRPDRRVVTFASDDGKTSFQAITADLITAGHYDPVLSIEWCADTVTPRFNDVAGRAAVIFYELKFTQKKTTYAQFDVSIPKTSQFYPLAYTERDLASYSHFYTFRFNTGGDLVSTQKLKDDMFTSLNTEERTKAAG